MRFKCEYEHKGLNMRYKRFVDADSVNEAEMLAKRFRQKNYDIVSVVQDTSWAA